MNQLTEKIILEIINATCNLKGRKCSQENKHYLKEIFAVLKTGQQWNAINNILNFDTYYKKFIYWTNNGVFEKAYYLLIDILKNNGYFNHDTLKELFTDTSMIKNIKGVDMLGKNHYDRFRNANKISVITTNNGIPLSVHMTAANIHDAKIFIPTFEKIKFKIIASNKYPKYIAADKGYISKNINKYCTDKNIKLIVPNKKNQINKVSFNDYKMKVLNKRHIVENFFSWIKNYKRIKNRYEKHFTNYCSFVFFACINIITKKI